MSAAELAEDLGLPVRRVETWLRRYRARYTHCYVPNEDRMNHEPAHIYRTAIVWPALMAWAQGQGG